MTRKERMMLRNELYEINPNCCWCGTPVVMEPQDRNDIDEMATIEHHYREGIVVLAHHRCNR